MLFVRSLERAEQILIAMKCRGFQGTYPLLHHFHFSLRDIKFAFLFIIGLVVFISSGTYFPDLFMKEGFPL
jgi:cobalt/nickel transport system permease protein